MILVHIEELRERHNLQVKNGCKDSFESWVRAERARLLVEIDTQQCGHDGFYIADEGESDSEFIDRFAFELDSKLYSEEAPIGWWCERVQVYG